MGGKKSKSYDDFSRYQNTNQIQNQNNSSNNLGYNNNYNHHNQYNQNRHNHANHNHWNHRMNHHHNHHHNNHHNHRNHNYHRQHHHNQNHHNSYNLNDQTENQFSDYFDNNNGFNEGIGFPPEDYPQDPFQHPDPRYLNQKGPRPVMNPNIDRMNQLRRMRRRPRRRIRRRRAFDPFVDGEFLAENNPEFFVDPNRPRYLTNKEVKFMKNTYWNPEDERASNSQSESSIQSSEPKYSRFEQTNKTVPLSPLERIKPPKLKKLNITPFKRVKIPDINFERTEPEKKITNQKNNILSRYNKKKYPTTFYAKPIRPKPPSNELHFKVFNDRKNPLNTAKYMVSSIRVPKVLNNEVTIKVDQ